MLLKQELGNKPLNNIEISRKCKKLFPRNFLGVFMQDSPVPDKSGYFIMNTDKVGRPGIHWISGIISGRNVYMYDSFGRLSKNIVKIFVSRMSKRGYTIHDADPTDQDQYGYTSVDCGARAISSLMIAKKYGIKQFMSL